MNIIRRLGKYTGGQCGFTLVELLTAIAVTTVIAVGITSAGYQLIKMNTTSINRQTAVSRVESAANTMSRDAQMSQQVTVGANNIQLQWTQWDDVAKISTQMTVIYNSTGGNLTRKVNAGAAVVIAQNTQISNISWTNKVLNLQISSTYYGAQAVIRKLQINPRPAQ
jgi:prepilin-type N-terminal cleavage/methylation domain-containing protein